MKKLKFLHDLVQLVLDGTNVVTWRLFDDKDLKVGDQLELIDAATEEQFAEAEITRIREKKLGEIQEEDFEGHERFEYTEDMLKHYRALYGERVTTNSMIKMIDFKLLQKRKES